MNLHNLTPAKDSTKNRKRIARGQGSGRGGTSTRGHKGAKSRSGYSRKIGFEGGQMPLQRRVPKFGFKNINRVEYKAINLDIIQSLIERKKVKEITPAILQENGLCSKNERVKRSVERKFSHPLTLRISCNGYSMRRGEAARFSGTRVWVR